MSVASRRGGPGGAPLICVMALAALSLLTFTRPGKRAIRRLAGWLDSRVDGFSEPNASSYARFIAPALRRLYERIADDVLTELSARGDSGPTVDGGSSGRELAVLDVGCGPGDLAAMLRERLPEARVVGVDLSPNMIELARGRHTTDGRLRFEVGDSADLPIESGSIDLVVSSLSLHHWPNPEASFAEIGRVLRLGGVALIYDLGLLTVGAERLPYVAREAGFPASRLRRERLGGGLAAHLFVRFRVDDPVDEPATTSAPQRGQPAMLESRPL